MSTTHMGLPSFPGNGKFEFLLNGIKVNTTDPLSANSGDWWLELPLQFYLGARPSNSTLMVRVIERTTDQSGAAIVIDIARCQLKPALHWKEGVVSMLRAHGDGQLLWEVDPLKYFKTPGEFSRHVEISMTALPGGKGNPFSNLQPITPATFETQLPDAVAPTSGGVHSYVITFYYPDKNTATFTFTGGGTHNFGFPPVAAKLHCRGATPAGLSLPADAEYFENEIAWT